MEAGELASDGGQDEKQGSSGEHLGGGTHGLRFRQSDTLGIDGRDRPTEGGEDESEGPGAINGSLAKAERTIYENGHTQNSDKQSDAETKSQLLGAENDDLQQSHEDGNAGQHHSGDARRHSLFGPEEATVVEDEDDGAEQRGSSPLARSGIGRAGGPEPGVKNGSGGEKAQGGEKKRRHFVDADADGVKRRAPDEVNDAEEIGRAHV